MDICTIEGPLTFLSGSVEHPLLKKKTENKENQIVQRLWGMPCLPNLR